MPRRPADDEDDDRPDDRIRARRRDDDDPPRRRSRYDDDDDRPRRARYDDEDDRPRRSSAYEDEAPRRKKRPLPAMLIAVAVVNMVFALAEIFVEAIYLCSIIGLMVGAGQRLFPNLVGEMPRTGGLIILVVMHLVLLGTALSTAIGALLLLLRRDLGRPLVIFGPALYGGMSIVGVIFSIVVSGGRFALGCGCLGIVIQASLFSWNQRVFSNPDTVRVLR